MRICYEMHSDDDEDDDYDDDDNDGGRRNCPHLFGTNKKSFVFF